jgi:hypothetical protein
VLAIGAGSNVQYVEEGIGNVVPNEFGWMMRLQSKMLIL